MSANPVNVHVLADTGRLLVALRLLSEALEGRPQVVDCFLHAIDSGAQLVRVDQDRGSAAQTGQLRVRLEPSDWLLGFLAALGAGNV